MTGAAFADLHQQVQDLLKTKVRRICTHARREDITTTQVYQQCLAAAYVAAAEGTPIKQAINELFAGRTSAVGDNRTRERVRKDGARNGPICWDSWGERQCEPNWPRQGEEPQMQRRSLDATATLWDRKLADRVVVQLEYQRVHAVLVQQVSPRDVAIMEAHYIEGVPQHEIAKQLGVGEGAINTAIYRARRRTRQALLRISHRAQLQQARSVA